MFYKNKISFNSSKWIYYIFGVLCISVFQLCLSNSLDQQWQNPKHFVQDRHELIPTITIAQKIHFHTALNNSNIWKLKPADTQKFEPLDESEVLGIQLFTGTYGNILTYESASITISNSSHAIHCTSKRKGQIKENNWTTLFFDKCLKQPSRLEPIDANQIAFVLYASSDAKFAVYETEDQDPALQIIKTRLFQHADLPDIHSNQAKNYGNNWNTTFFEKLNKFYSVAITLLCGILLGLTIFCYRHCEFNSKKLIFCFFGVWFLFGSHHALMSPPFQDPDEPALLLGIVYENSATPDRTVAHLTSYSALSQFNCVKMNTKRPILPDQVCEEGFKHDFIIASPSHRGVLYQSISKAVYRFADFTWLKYSKVFASYLGTYVKMGFFLFNALILLVVISINFYFQRTFTCIALFGALLIPAYFPLVGGITNYGSCFIFGLGFFGLLIPEGSHKNKLICLLISPVFALGVVMSATSQINFLLLTPFWIALATLGLIFTEKRELRFSHFYPLLWFLVLILLTRLIVGEHWIARSDRFESKILSSSYLTHFKFIQAGLAFSKFNLFSLLTVFVVLISMLSIFAAARLRSKSFFREFKLTCHRLFSFSALAALAFYLFYAIKWGNRPEYIASLNSVEQPGFVDFFVSAFKSLISTNFSIKQDFFLVETYFMTFGWLDTLAHPMTTFVFRHFVTFLWFLLFLKVVFSKSNRTVVPVFMLLSWFLYWTSAFFGTWLEGHSLVARYVSPAIGAVVLSLYFELFKNKRASFLFVLVAFVGLNIYGYFYRMPMRFVVGLP